MNSKPTLTCPFCNKEAPWVENREIYGRNYGKSYMAYYCRDCDAYVGCHQNTTKPLGTMANKETRNWRSKAHAHIDPFWKSGKLSRNVIYTIISMEMGKPIHIGESDLGTCQKICSLDIGRIIENNKRADLRRGLNRKGVY